MDNIAPEICAEHQKVIDERFARDKERIETLEDNQKRIELLTVQMGEILKNQNEAIKNHSSRLEHLESRPGGLWDKVVSGIIAAVTGGLAAAFMALIVR